MAAAIAASSARQMVLPIKDESPHFECGNCVLGGWEFSYVQERKKGKRKVYALDLCAIDAHADKFKTRSESLSCVDMRGTGSMCSKAKMLRAADQPDSRAVGQPLVTLGISQGCVCMPACHS
eukprot:1143445-Pelagomonas_calceolata.AAC.1